MPGGGYDVSKYPETPATPYTVAFKPSAEPDAQPSEEQTKFVLEIESTIRRINGFMGVGHGTEVHPPRYGDYLERVFFAAKVGVQWVTGNLVLGHTSLKSTQEYFLENEGPEIRKSFLRSLHKTTASFLIAALTALLAVDYLVDHFIVIEIDWKPYVTAALVSVIGVSIAAWLRRLLDFEVLTWEGLRSFSTSVYAPALRFTVLIAIALVAMFLLETGGIELSIGGYELQSFRESPRDAVAIGLLCGFAEKRMTKTVVGAFGG